MTPEFFAIVAEMRAAQKKYFKSRMSYDLEKAKKLEKEVDERIAAECDKKDSISSQKKLF